MMSSRSRSIRPVLSHRIEPQTFRSLLRGMAATLLMTDDPIGTSPAAGTVAWKDAGVGTIKVVLAEDQALMRDAVGSESGTSSNPRSANSRVATSEISCRVRAFFRARKVASARVMYAGGYLLLPRCESYIG